MNGSSTTGWVGDWWATFRLGSREMPDLYPANDFGLHPRWYEVFFQGDSIGCVARWQSGRPIWRVDLRGEGHLEDREFASRQDAAAYLFEYWTEKRGMALHD